MNGPWLRHLLWKDLRLLRSLIIASLAAPLGIAILASLLRWSWPQYHEEAEAAFGFLLACPWLVAIGAPPMLVGTEDEERTFDWLRRLPVAWWQVLVSQVIAGFLAVLMAALWTGLLLGIGHWFFDFSQAGMRGDPSLPVLVASGGAIFVYANLAVLTCGFLTAFLIRNALASALLAVPLSLFWLIIASVGGDMIAPELFGRRDPDDTLVMSLLVSLVLHLLATAMVLSFVRQRLRGPSDEPRRWLPSRSQARPVALPLKLADRPGVVQALLWQHVTQSRWVLIAVSSIASASILCAVFVPANNEFGIFGHLSLPIIPFLQLTLGVSAFHGDQRAVRRNFFADRGLSPTLVWWTRLAVPATISIGVTLLWVLVCLRHRPEYVSSKMLWAMPAAYCLLFLVGASTGQWFRRGAMAFFVAPAVAYFSTLALMLAIVPVSDFLEWKSYSLLGVLCFLSLLISTWHVNRLWLRGRDGAALMLPACGWIGLPIVLAGLVSTIAYVTLKQ